jgi:hypothetical protein
MNDNAKKPHPQAAIIKAWADGAAIQFRDTGKLQKPGTSEESWWEDYYSGSVNLPSFGSDLLSWRIKPVQKTGWICIVNGPNSDGDVAISAIYTSKQAAVNAADSRHPHTKLVAIVEIAYEDIADSAP